MLGRGYQQAELAPEAAEDFFKAVCHRNKLLEFQHQQARRTLVYDDQADYFSTSNAWMSAEERAHALKKEADAAARESDKRKASICTPRTNNGTHRAAHAISCHTHTPQSHTTHA